MMCVNLILDLIKKNIHLILLGLIIYIAIYLRWSTSNFDIIFDYDPWWFYRHAKTLLENNFVPPKWDLLSYYPPGRPVDYQLGWSYTIATSYVLVKDFFDIPFIKFAGLFVAIFSGLSAIPAYLVGRLITNKWGGLATAFFATITPTFLSVSMAGYPDSDVVYVFYTFLTVFATLYAIQSYKGIKNKKTWFSIAFAVFTYWLFAFNWNTSWYIYFIFLSFIPILIVFKIFEFIISKKEKLDFKLILKGVKNIILPILLIGILGEIFTILTWQWPFNTIPPHQQFLNGFNFLTGRALIVNISVAELQPIKNVFDPQEFRDIVSRVGIYPIIFGFGTPWLPLPISVLLLLFLKWRYKKDVHIAEYFAIIWLLISLWLISRGIRFSLLFSISVATAAGFIISNLIDFARNRKDVLIESMIFGFIIFALFWHFSENLKFSSNIRGLDIGQNWKAALDWLKANSDKDTLVMTWWDPGHIITGYTGLKVHADGAHCGPDSCIPYNHNIRIQDMGRIFSTNSEEEALNIIRKYTSLTKEQCQEVRNKFDGLMPENACDPVKKVYLIASNDLIGKYYWLSYFGSGGQGRNYVNCFLSQEASQRVGTITYSCAAGFQMEVSVLQTNQTLYFVMNAPQIGIRNTIIRDAIFTQQNQLIVLRQNNITQNIIDGLFYIDPSFQYALFMEASVRDALFTNMFFFDGKGVQELNIPRLEKFNLVFKNPEIRIYEVSFI
ncbi:MAG: STT3 domain-containing protein [Candidatus Aenigmatarchaeota archaeon]